MTKGKEMRAYSSSDAFGQLCQIAESRFSRLPKPLPWIEPSINMLYLECVCSYLVGNEFSVIMSMSALLEHVLRLALLDKDNTGLTRTLSLGQLDDVRSISEAIERALAEGLIEDGDKAWWDKVAKFIRNKSAHYIIPKLIKEFTRQQYAQGDEAREGYTPTYYRITDENGHPESDIAHDWGMFFHKVGFYVARKYIVDGTEHLKKIIAKTKWKPDRSCWASQEMCYNNFFSYGWDVDDMKRSLADMCVDL
jgi:hypothetical protein